VEKATEQKIITLTHTHMRDGSLIKDNEQEKINEELYGYSSYYSYNFISGIIDVNTTVQ